MKLNSLVENDIPFTLEISAVPEEAPGCPIMALPAWTYLRRPLADTQSPNFDLRRVYFIQILMALKARN